MIRLAAVAVAFWAFAMPADARLNSSNHRETNSLRQLMPKSGLSGTEIVTPPAELQMTKETEVVLNGRPCAYKDIPAGASIARIVLATDGRTVARIEFRSR